MSASKYKRTKLACYSAYFSMTSAFCLPPLLFVTFHEMYGVSWTLLGTLVTINFCTQFAIDLIFTIFSKKFDIRTVIRVMPLITSFGLLIYAIFPMAFPQMAYAGLLIGTVIFSVSAGLSEVLLSPIIAAIPSENPQKEMSLLHSLYAFGVFSIVIISTLFLKCFGTQHWMYLTILLAMLPVVTSVLFFISPLPDMDTEEQHADTGSSKQKMIGICLCFGCIFLGSCAENVMSNWISGYMEAQLQIDKAVGDILGMAMFAILLGGTRICYAKWGKNICRMLLVGMAGATACYLLAGLSSQLVPSFLACVLTGIFTAMLWPGTLIMMEQYIPGAGVAAYALMAAGGDLGASIAPQLMGIISDRFQMQTGMLVSAVFPAAGVILMLIVIRLFRSKTFSDC